MWVKNSVDPDLDEHCFQKGVDSLEKAMCLKHIIAGKP